MDLDSEPLKKGDVHKIKNANNYNLPNNSSVLN